MSASELAVRLGTGLLSFPVTHFDGEGALDPSAYAEHVAWLASYPAAGLFAAGGTGEFFSLTPDEVSSTVRTAIAAAPVTTPIIAPAGYGTHTAREMARSAERDGADGILLFPPYLTEVSQEGLEAHVHAVCAATSLGVIVYHRSNAAYAEETVERLAEDCPNLIGFKDGMGGVEQLVRLTSLVGDRLVYIGGVPTAELFAAPYLSMGITTYSSAIFNFMPDFALAFYDAVRRRDDGFVVRALNEFVIPYCDIRQEKPGYAVSIIKAGLTVVGRPAGSVRAPISDLDPVALGRLTALISELGGDGTWHRTDSA
ncbi:5-dehydro-4-deoxyglucarate dehydratase [Nocardioides sp. LHD-245]|uniref:5-dehydro-4-deoxyglucarate dehydratase n=1 Tax=Nocardioides sp. LHD-245 TaxID=3051387 RepID=UPI0027DFA31A|nr:5-dehydro-4-deoxyglucarate dehydratase [Nocardioides sp. LHD-245]